jgi:import inner membrane translocase subunit TIM23
MLRPVSRTGLFHCRRQLAVFPIARSLSSLVSSRPCSPPNVSTKLRQLRQFTSSAAPNSDRLTWDEFLRLRRQRRLTGLLAAVPSSALGIYIGFQYFGSEDIDPTQTIFGFDPFLMNSAFVLGCGLLGWLVGPTVGRGLWRVFHRNQAHLISQVCPSMMSCSR